MIPDIINSIFEAFGGVFVLLNVFKLYKDKKVRGIHWGSTIFFTSWGLWNMWYYPHLHQLASFVGGCFLAGSNVIWFLMRLRYNR